METAPASAAAGDRTPTQARRSLLAEATDLTYQRRTRSLLAHTPLLALIVPLGWGAPGNLGAAGLLVGYQVVSLVSSVRYNRRVHSEAEARRAAAKLYVLLGVLGLIYNVIFMNLARGGVPQSIQLLTLITALFCAGGAAAYQYLRGLAIVFIVCAMAPQVVWQLVHPDGSSLMAFVLVVFVVFMSNTSLDLHRDARERLSMTRNLEDARNEAERLARVDALTGLLNRRALLELGELLIANARRHRHPLAVVMVDIDRFKAINDTHGHAVGDAAIVAVANALSATCRASDVVGRLGGDELALILPESDAEAASKAAERLLVAVRGCRVTVGPARVEITASLGAAILVDEDRSLDDVLQRADRALYDAKAAGRDRAAVAQSAATAS